MADTSTSGQFKAHQGTYGSFLSLLKWGTVAAAAVTVLVVVLIS